MAASKVIVKDRGWNRFVRRIKRHKSTNWEIGIFADELYPDGTYIASIGSIQEFGTSRIPQRSFMRSTVEEFRAEINRRIAKNTGLFVDKGFEPLEEAAEFLREKIEQRIDTFSDPGNAELTIDRKGKDDPLVDTGHLRQSIKTREKKK